MDPQDREHSSPYDPPPPPGSPYDPPPPPGPPYGAPPPGSPHAPQSQPYPYDTPPGPKPRRSTFRTVAGIVCLVLGGLLALGALASLASGGPSDFAGSAERAGYLVGTIVFPLLFIVAGVLLLRKPKH